MMRTCAWGAELTMAWQPVSVQRMAMAAIKRDAGRSRWKALANIGRLRRLDRRLVGGR